MGEKLTEKVENENRYIASNFKRKGNVFHSIVECQQEIINKLGELEDFIEEVDNATVIYKDGIATFHIDMVLTSETIETVKKYFNCKEIER